MPPIWVPIWVPGTSPAGALWLGRELPWLGSVQLFRNTELRPGPLLLEAVAGCFVPLIAYLAGAEVVVGSKGV